MDRRLKRLLKILIVLGALVAIWRASFLIDFTAREGNVWGVSFASAHSRYYGFDPKELYLAILDDLGARHIRISVYWNQVEPKKDKYDFSELDWQMNEAQKRNAQIILAVGRRVPRWPECHAPEWAKVSPQKEDEYLIAYLEKIVSRYQDHPALRMWQVENEPFLDLFGECPKHNKGLLLKEIALVKNLDPIHPIMVTDSGELGSWLRTRALSEYLGTSIYRVVAQSWSGYVRYGHYIPPAYYKIKAQLVKKPLEKIIGSELQMEPWTPEDLLTTALNQQYKSMNIKQFKNNLAFAKKTGIREFYLWGTEWWYWMAKKHNEPIFWNTAKELFY